LSQVTAAIEAAREVALSAHYSNLGIQIEPRAFNRLVVALGELGVIRKLPIEREVV
jgi:hypothetical protein